MEVYCLKYFVTEVRGDSTADCVEEFMNMFRFATMDSSKHFLSNSSGRKEATNYRNFFRKFPQVESLIHTSASAIPALWALMIKLGTNHENLLS